LARDSVPVEMAQQKRQNFGMAAVTESPSVQLLVGTGGGEKRRWPLPLYGTLHCLSSQS
jgi:hypothetical protein